MKTKTKIWFIVSTLVLLVLISGLGATFNTANQKKIWLKEHSDLAICDDMRYIEATQEANYATTLMTSWAVGTTAYVSLYIPAVVVMFNKPKKEGNL